jgi:hypothetical protein
MKIITSFREYIQFYNLKELKDLEDEIICPICEGTGICPDCNGKGEVPCPDCVCSECGGVDSNYCICNGFTDPACEECKGLGSIDCCSCYQIYDSNGKCSECKETGATRAGKKIFFSLMCQTVSFLESYGSQYQTSLKEVYEARKLYESFLFGDNNA